MLWHAHQVVEVFEVAARDRVARAVRVGEGVEKGLQAPLQQLHKGLF